MIGCIILAAVMTSTAQQDIRFYVEVDSDSVHVDEVFEIKYTVEGGTVKDLDMPEMDQFIPISGPNLLSEISIVNGRMSQLNSMAYRFTARSSGIYLIGPASIKVDGEILETESVRIVVYGKSGEIKKGPPKIPPPPPSKKSNKGPIIRI